jgi:hypothetical protein
MQIALVEYAERAKQKLTIATGLGKLRIHPILWLCLRLRALITLVPPHRLVQPCSPGRKRVE